MRWSSIFIFYFYSLLKASIGFIFEARYAGTKPATKPEITKLKKAKTMSPQPTEGSLIKYFSKLSPMRASVRTPIPTPINPEITVITILSCMMSPTILLGLAPMAFLTPISWVLSFTIYTMILLMPIMPAKSVPAPITLTIKPITNKN